MFIKDLILTNFRNYEKEKLQFAPGICIVQGANGQGKSNLLEAIYCLCFGRSFKNYKDSDLVKWERPFYFIQGTVVLQKHPYKMEVGFETGKRRKVVKVNGKVDKKFSLEGNFPVVFFVPEDLEMIRRGPEERRRFIDREICQISALYRDYLIRYNRIIAQKNKILKENIQKKELREMLHVWNRQIVHFGSRIIKIRNEMISIWSSLASRNYACLFQESQLLSISYENCLGIKEITTDIEEIEKTFQNEIKKTEEEEMRRGYSLLGPHREDLLFLLDGREARRFASHGQQRSAIISLKAAQIQFFNDKKEKPLFILDDLFSELDEFRMEQCFSLFKGAEQVFITITRKDNYLEPFLEKFSDFSFFHVSEGKVMELKENGKSRTFC
ncbi:MAG: DNA replication/repair protein RecF [Bacillota bacterium]|nr:DNA replication/repair protein RecF [Bacillota bacterium]